MKHTPLRAKAISARYLKIVEWSEPDQCFVGHCPGLFEGGVHGDDEVEVYRELCHAAEEWIRLLHDEKKPLPPATAGRKYSGKFVVRVSPAVHQRAALKALAHRESLNQFVERALVAQALRPASLIAEGRGRLEA